MIATHPPIWKRRGFIIAAVAIGVPLLGLGWYLFSPLFLNKTVVEDFPTVATTQTPDVTTTTQVPDVTTTIQPAPRSSESVAPLVATTTTPPTTTTPTTTGAAEPQEPVRLVAGEVKGADSFHQGTGTATIYELPDGSRVLRLEELDVTNGPDLHVYLSPVATPSGSADVTAEGYVDLGSLKGNRGNQNYDIPADFEIGDELSVVIYCVPFHVIFATATLGPS